VLNLTSQSTDGFVRFSPFYGHGDIPVPFLVNTTSQTVEGVWQGLKIFAHEGMDPQKFHLSMKKLKRGKTTKRGEILGHHGGGNRVLSYVDARREIYLPAYEWVLKHKLQQQVNGLLERLRRGEKFVFLDYYTNEDVNDEKNRLSHAGVLKRYLLEKLRA